MTISLPQWPDPESAAGAAFFAAARKFHALYRGAGFERPFAFAFVAMAEAESGFDVNALGDYVDATGAKLPWSRHPTGTPTSFGAYQRKRPRTDAIRDGRKDARGQIIVPGLDFDLAALALARANTIENEVRATLWELKAFPNGYGAAAIESAGTAFGAAYQATVLFEKAGTAANGAAEKRGAMAETWALLAGGVWPKSRGPRPDGWMALTEGWA